MFALWHHCKVMLAKGGEGEVREGAGRGGRLCLFFFENCGQQRSRPLILRGRNRTEGA